MDNPTPPQGQVPATSTDQASADAPTTRQDGQQAAPTTTVVVSPTAPPQPASAPASGQEPQQVFDADYVKLLRAEAAKHRKEAADTAARLKALEDAALSETEKRDKRLSELETQQADWQRERQELITRQEVNAASIRLKIVDPDAAYALLDHSKIVSENGKPTNIDELLTALVKAKPYLLPPAASSGNHANPASSGVSSAPSEADAIYAQIVGGARDFWDEKNVRAHGGGVFVVTKE